MPVRKKAVARPKRSRKKPKAVAGTGAPPKVKAPPKPEAPPSKPEKRPGPTTAYQWQQADFGKATEFLGSVWTNDTMAMFTGNGDVGKSMFAIALGLAMSCHPENGFLEWMPTGKPARVLYILGEMTRRKARHYIDLQMKALGIKNDSGMFKMLHHQEVHIPKLNVRVTTEDNIPIKGEDGLQWLKDQVENFKPDFIIFDNIFRLISVASAGAQTWLNQVDGPIVQYLNKADIGQLWLHHTDKGGKKQYGTVAKEISLDLSLYGEKVDRRGIGFNLRFVKGKGYNPDQANTDWDEKYVTFRNGQWFVSEPQAPLDLDVMDTPKPTGRPNQSMVVAEEAYDQLVRNYPDGFVPKTVWLKKAIELNIAPGANNPGAHKQAFNRALIKLYRNARIEYSDDNKSCKLLPDEHVVILGSDDDSENASVH